MSTLLVLGYPTEEKAKEAYQEVLSLGAVSYTHLTLPTN